MTESSNNSLRSRARIQRRALSADDRQAASLRIQRTFLQSRLFFSGRRFACYFAMTEEVDTSLIFDRLWRAGKDVFAPVTDEKMRLRFLKVEPDTLLRRHRLGLWEPTSGAEIQPELLDTVLTPVVAFDRFGHRIGMGGGCYDRAFSFLAYRKTLLRPKLVGLAFDCQQVEKISPNPWDIRLYRVISESA